MKQRGSIVQAISISQLVEQVCPCDEPLHEGWRLANRGGAAAQFLWKLPGSSTCAGGNSNPGARTDTLVLSGSRRNLDR